MSGTTSTQHNPEDTNLPGEVERDNDAHRPNEPKPGKRESTAQETAKEVTPKP